MCIYTYISIHICREMCVFIYIYICVHACMSLSLSLSVYIYIYYTRICVDLLFVLGANPYGVAAAVSQARTSPPAAWSWAKGASPWLAWGTSRGNRRSLIHVLMHVHIIYIYTYIHSVCMKCDVM